MSTATKTTTRAAVAILLASLGLAGCGGGQETTVMDAPATEESQTKPAAATATRSEPGDDVVAGDWIRPAVGHQPFDGERRLRNIRQLTFAGENAEAYWSFDETRLSFQSAHGDVAADQIFIMPIDGGEAQLASTGTGRTTCAYFMPGDQRVLYASTHLAGAEPPKRPGYDPTLGYVWPVYKTHAIVTSRLDGSDTQVLADVLDAYDAEATVSPTGDRIVFTSGRDGDLDLYSMAIDGSDVRRLTDAPGYDGGAFFSWDGTKIVWRAPKVGTVDVDEFRDLVARELVRPDKLEIWIMDADGANKRMITDQGAASFAPFWHPDGKRIVFSSNLHDPRGGNFEIFLIDIESGDLEQVTHFARRREGAHRSDDFDGFPMFNRDGSKLVFCSNRHNERANETNVFVADWVSDVGH